MKKRYSQINKKVSEQIEYGDRPERMDPRLVSKLQDPEGLYSQNPAMRKGTSDVERLVSSRFQKVAQKLSDVTGIQDLSSKQVQAMVYQEMMTKLPSIMRIESANKEQLEQLAVEICLEETETPDNWYQIDANLGMPSTAGFRMGGQDNDEGEEEMDFGSDFDIDEFTKKDQIELEKHKRNIINAIIQGAAKKGHYLFQKPSIKSRLDAINPSLYRDYLGIMAINDFLYFSMEQMIEMMSQSGQGVAGKVQLGDADEEYQEEGADTKIMATGLIFPILCHEIIKGLEEAKGRHGLPQDADTRQKVMQSTDTLANEPMQLRIGPEIVEKLRNALPDEIFDESNKGLINWFHISLYKLPADEFLEIIGNIISTDKSKVDRGKSSLREIMNEAQSLKDEFENYKEEEGIDSDEEDEDDIDDFLRSLGIEPPSNN
jgi:hypothetical protein